MNFELSDQQLQLAEAARRFARQELGEIAAEMERDNKGMPLEIRRRIGEMGFLGINIAEAYGGAGLGNLDALLVLEQFARVSQAVAWPVFESIVGPARTIEAFGSDALRDRVLPRVCRGELMIAAAMSEPGAGTALTDLSTSAADKGDVCIINGTKRWCSGAGDAEAYLVFCRFGELPGAKGIGAVYVDRDAGGLTFGERETLMGFRGVSSADMYFDAVEVPADNIVAGPGRFSALMQHFNLERCGNAMMCVANAAEALEYVTDYVAERKQFGKPICEFQSVQTRLADVWLKVQSARLLVYKAVGSGSELPSVLDSSTAKCYANSYLREAVSDAMQIMGGYGYSAEYGLERRFRDIWGWGVAGGVIDVQKTNIASALLGRRFDQRR